MNSTDDGARVRLVINLRSRRYGWPVSVGRRLLADSIADGGKFGGMVGAKAFGRAVASGETAIIA